ncbi:MAG: hypothetical protein KDI44_16300 [Thiothrix sp.]|nr:hypothetical protein [Thiothrix sp.]
MTAESLNDRVDRLTAEATCFESALERFERFLAERQQLQVGDCSWCYRLPTCRRWRHFPDRADCPLFTIEQPKKRAEP